MALMSEFVERFNREGGLVPPINPDHLASMWNLMREVNERFPNTGTCGLGGHVGVGLSAAGMEGVTGDDVAGLSIRLALLQSFVERNVVYEHFQSDQFIQKVFRAIASFPCDKEDVGEAVLQLQLKNLPVEQASELRKNLIGGGYNPDEPKVDSKFLKWMRSQN